MEIQKLYTIFFSPTGTSRKSAEAVARGFDAERPLPRIEVDLTHTENAVHTLASNEATVLAVPVYGGRIAPIARKRLAAIRGTGSPAILVVVYGNRAFEGALAELDELARQQGFIPVAAAACIGEHSYSSAQHPIAAGRPDEHDLAQIEGFGRRTARRLSDMQHPTPIDIRRIARPKDNLWSKLRFIRFVLGYQRQQKRHPKIYLPATDAARCTHCGRCAAICPTGAIPRGGEEQTDKSRCIRCCACVKGCPVGARSFDTPFAEVLSHNFGRPKPNVFLPAEE